MSPSQESAVLVLARRATSLSEDQARQVLLYIDAITQEESPVGRSDPVPCTSSLYPVKVEVSHYVPVGLFALLDVRYETPFLKSQRG